MNTLLIVSSCVLGYLILGLVWARSQVVKLQGWLTKLQKKNGPTPAWGWDIEFHVLGHIVLWPLIVLGNLLGLAISWVTKPLKRRRERVGGLRARADEMAHMCEGMSDSEDKRILLACVAENRELAEELEI